MKIQYTLYGCFENNKLSFVAISVFINPWEWECLVNQKTEFSEDLFLKILACWVYYTERIYLTYIISI